MNSHEDTDIVPLRRTHARTKTFIGHYDSTSAILALIPSRLYPFSPYSTISHSLTLYLRSVRSSASHSLRSPSFIRLWALSTLEEPRDNRSVLPHSHRFRSPAPASTFQLLTSQPTFQPFPQFETPFLFEALHISFKSHPLPGRSDKIYPAFGSATTFHQFTPPYRTLKQPKLFRNP
jgi:hypothetical protein